MPKIIHTHRIPFTHISDRSINTVGFVQCNEYILIRFGDKPHHPWPKPLAYMPGKSYMTDPALV